MSDLDRWIGACLIPELRVPGTLPGHPGGSPDPAYLERFPPAAVIVFGRTPSGPGDPGPLLEALRGACERAGGPTPLACADFEQGAGLHFAGATRLPPALALGMAARERGAAGLDLVRAAGELTGREARARGVDLVLAPVCDIDSNPDNPIIAVRSFGPSPGEVTERATAFLRGLHAGGVGGCAKHWPGHGDTDLDSHLELPRIERSAAHLAAHELAPFRALCAAGVDATMVAHLDVPALTGTPGQPVTLSASALDQLRQASGFTGAVLSDGIDMGALAKYPERYAQALAAGCDGLLCPEAPESAALALRESVAAGRLDPQRLASAAAAMERLRSGLRSRRAAPVGPGTTASSWTGEELARAALWSPNPGAWSSLPFNTAPGSTAVGGWELVEAFPGHGSPEAQACVSRLAEGLRAAGSGVSAERAALVVVTGETLAGRREAGLSSVRATRLEHLMRTLEGEGRPTGLLWLASPRSLPAAWAEGGRPVLVGFAPTPPMVEAALCWLAKGPFHP